MLSRNIKETFIESSVMQFDERYLSYKFSIEYSFGSPNKSNTVYLIEICLYDNPYFTTCILS